MAKVTKEQQAEAREKLQAILKPGMQVNCILRTVARSGMSRTISLFVVKDGEVLDITFYVGRLLGYPVTDVHGHRALKVQGCGMDMGFHVVYCLAYNLFKDEGKITEDPGYSLNHRWT